MRRRLSKRAREKQSEREREWDGKGVRCISCSSSKEVASLCVRSFAAHEQCRSEEVGRQGPSLSGVRRGEEEVGRDGG